MFLLFFRDLLKAEQFGLFDMPTLIGPHVRQDGTVVKQHMRRVRRKVEPQKAKVIARHEHPHTLDLFAHLDKPAPRVGQTGDLFAEHQDAPKAASPEVKKPEVQPGDTGDLFGDSTKLNPASGHGGDLEKLQQRVVRYASGMSRANDFNPAVSVEHGVGVEIGQMSDASLRELADAIVHRHADVFVDSGAFGAFRAGLRGKGDGATDFDQVLAKYDRLTDLIGELNDAEEHVTPPILVAPDKVGDQAGSLELLEQHKDWIRAHLKMNVARIMVPLQRGELSISQAYDRAVSILGSDNFIVGIPSNAEALTDEQLTSFLRERKPKRVHILGALSGKKLTPRLKAILAAGSADGIEVSADANLLRSKLMQGGIGKEGRKQLVQDTLDNQEERDRRLNAFIDKHGGVEALREQIKAAPKAKADKLVGKMAEIARTDEAAMRERLGLAKPAGKRDTEFVTPPKRDLPTVELDGDTWYVENVGTRRDDGKFYAHLSSATRGRQARNGVHPISIGEWIDLPAPEDAPGALPIVEHVTKGGRGKTIRGVLIQDEDRAKAIDAYSFRKDGKWFVREKHLVNGRLPDEAAPVEEGPKEGDRDADGLVFHDGRWHREDEQDVASDAPKGPLPLPERTFAELLEAAGQSEDGIPTFFEPEKTVRTEHRAKAAGQIPQAEADKRIAEWKAHAKAQGESRVNQGKVVLSLFDTSGEWSQPWVDAGYEVHRFDIQDGMDINDFSVEHLTETLGIERCDVLLAAPPCTDFSISGAHAWKKKDADGRTAASVQLVEQTLRTVEFFKPAVWALENPVGRIKKLAGLPKPALTFQPCNFGNPYTKRTLLWGDMRTDLPLANVDPVDGSKMTTKYSGKDKYQRSLTPEGFAYSFFMANNLADMGAADRLAQEFKGVGREAFQGAVDAGHDESDIRSAIEDSYYDQDLDGVRDILRDMAPEPTPEPTPGKPTPKANGAEFGTLFHGTARPFEQFQAANFGKQGGGYNHQGKGVYLTDDRAGLARYFAQTAADKVAFRMADEDEADKLQESGGVVLQVQIDPQAKILDLRQPEADAQVRELFKHSVGDAEVAQQLRDRVQALGYDGIAFLEPNRAEGWESKADAVTVVVYDESKTHIKGHMPGPLPKSGLDYSGEFNPRDIPAFGVSAGVSKGERIRLNSEAVALIKRGGPFSELERDTLSKYSGNGGVGDSLNEFYTDTRVAAGMWSLLTRLGLPAGAQVLEPSAATGVFMHTAPTGTKVVGVELDGISSSIAQALHGERHEVNNASLERFATQDTRQFDAVIGNPPFGLRGALIKDDKPHLATAEQYFIDTALDKTKAGGVVALVLPSGVMDSKTGRAFRENVLRKADFMGALRMPNTAFEHAHTGVTTDVLLLRKRPDDVAGALGVVDQDALKALGIWDDEFLSGGYFTGRGAGNVLGTQTEGWRAKAGMGQDITVEGSMVGVPEAIANFQPEDAPQPVTMEAVLHTVPADQQDRVLSAAAKRPYAGAKVGDTKVVDGVTYVLQGNPPRWHKVEEMMERAPVADAMSLAADIDRLMNGQAVDRPALEEAVRAYVAAHGIPSKNADLMAAAAQDKKLYRLVGAVKPDGSLSDLVTGTTRQQAGTLDSAAQSLAIEHGSFTAADLAERWGKGDADEALDHLYASKAYALNPDGTWTTSDNYLAGELWPKLDAAREAAADEQRPAIDREKFRDQAARLEEVIDPASLDDVFIAVNQAWIPTEVVAEFFTQKNKNGNKWQQDLPPVQIDFADGVYKISGGNQYGETKLLDTYLNRTGVRKDDKSTIDAMNREFKEWVLTSRHRDSLEDAYNRKFRGFAERTYSEEPFDIPGLKADGLKKYQYAGLRWAMDAGKGIIAADVGLGKTARGLILARLAKAEGRAKRPMIVVPKSVLANWYAEAEKWFPGSRVLTIGESYSRDEDGKLIGRQDTPAERKRKYHDLTQNDYDFILISQPAFEEVDVSPAMKNNYLADDFWVQRGDKLGNAGDKRIKKVREAYEQSVAQREFSDRTDAVYFEDLGVDMLMLDEGHAYKNLYAARNRFGETPKFLGGQGQSNRAFDMSFKTRYVREQNGGKNVFALTATPTKNSPLEIYSMLSYVAPEAFERIGIRNSEEFLDRFCTFTSENILTTTGDIEEALVTSGFQNMDELREIMRRYIHRTTADQVGLQLPERDDHMHMVDMDVEQQAAYLDLRAQAEEAAKNDDASGDAHIFSIMDKMSKAAMDLELLDPKAHAGHVSPKYLEAAKQIVNGAQDGGQVVFADFVGAHEKIAQELVKRGIPRNQIAIINAQVANSSLKRQRIADDFNSGKVKVVIGNTATMGEGINLQMGTTDIHHLDLPWEPASVQQRNGRGLRQGNTSAAVRIHTYLSKGSFDGYKYQTVAAKKDWQDELWNGGNEIANHSRPDNLAREDMLIMLAADPEEARKQLKENKAAALERFGADQRRKVAVQFTRLQGLRRSMAGMGSKASKSAIKLAAEIEKARSMLLDSKYFTAKDLIDSEAPAVIHPDTGAGITLNTVVHLGEKSKISEGGDWVVTGVNPADGRLRLRKYAGTRSQGIELADLGGDVKVSQLDEQAEAAEIARAAEEAVKAGEAAINSPAKVKDLPASTVATMYPQIQAQLKEAARSYKMDHGFYTGKIALVDQAGNPSVIEYYHAKDKLDDHDFLLASPEHRAKALEAFHRAEQTKKFERTIQSSGRRGSKTTWVVKPKYEGGWDWHTNPWLEAGKKVFGPEFEQDAMRYTAQKAATAARKAPTLAGAYQAIKTLAQMPAYGSERVTMPKRGIATLYAKAKREKALDTPAKEALGIEDGHDGKIINRDLPLVTGLVLRANDSGHRDLAATMILDHYRNEPRKALDALDLLYHSTGDQYGRNVVGQTPGTVVRDAIKYLVGKHPELASVKVAELPFNIRSMLPYAAREKTLGEGLEGVI